MPAVLDYHRELISDPVRTDAFRSAIFRVVKPGDVVIDLGSGSGVLAFFACQAGAARVYAIEKQHVADAALVLAKQNGFADRVRVVHEYSLHAELPEQANVLVTETLGTFGLEEQILGLTLDARARLLRPDATLIPSSIALSAVPVELPEVFERHVGWWSEPRYGLDLSPARVFASNTLTTADIEPASYLAAPAEIASLDLATIETPDVHALASFTAARNGILHGFGGWFTATLAEGIVLSNASPRATVWRQAFLPLEQPIAIPRGATIELELQTHDGRSWRWRGRAGGVDFDQTTWLSAPPCAQLGGGA